ncbi:hypothetical protein FRB99_004046 [Tulasnella sp. 403]|nr:hypothetical protein FRB99_004046 [Tulasnella sp. 403]
MSKGESECIDYNGFQTFDFPFDAFNGPMNDTSCSRAVYILLTPTSTLDRPPTKITRRDGTPVAEIHWRWFFKKQRIVLGEKGDDVRSGLLQKSSSSRWTFKDAHGNHFYWKDLVCYNASDDQVIARYTRQIEHYLTLDSCKASLAVHKHHLAPETLDYILLSALLMEMKRRVSERIHGQHPQPPKPQKQAHHPLKRLPSKAANY